MQTSTTRTVPRVLVVDDNRDSSDVLAELLTLHGMTARPAYNGAQALALTQDFRPHVLLLDLGMPGIDGYAVAAALQEDDVHRPYIVALTAWNDEATLKRVNEAGFDRHLAKPSSLKSIMQAITDSTTTWQD